MDNNQKEITIPSNYEVMINGELIFEAGRLTLMEVLDKNNARYSAKSFDEWKENT